jgi:hypothetical protein
MSHLTHQSQSNLPDHQIQPPILVGYVPSPPVAVRARGFSPLT